MPGVAMARKKGQGGGRGPEPSRRGVVRIAIQASPEWASYVERGAKHCRTDISKLIDAALVDYLRARGFAEDPPDRVP